jgi:disulfide bond formation protein DsbB
MRSEFTSRDGASCDTRRAATALILVGSTALLGGALAFQYLGNLAPCEMCLWQRWPHVAAVGLALLAWALRFDRRLLAVAALSLLAGAGIGAYHAGVEWHLWAGPPACTAAPLRGSIANITAMLLATPLIRCDAAAWTLFGVSMAGYNTLLSTAIGGASLWLITKDRATAGTPSKSMRHAPIR